MKFAWTGVLLFLLWALHGQLWFGRGSVQALQIMLAELATSNIQSAERNDRLTSEILDLKEGLETVERTARLELGMVKPNEVYVQFVNQ